MHYNILSSDNASTVVAEYAAEYRAGKDYQSEAQLEQDFIKRLQGQGYEYISLSAGQAGVTDEAGLVLNLRHQLETLNGYTFTDSEWERKTKSLVRRRRTYRVNT